MLSIEKELEALGSDWKVEAQSRLARTFEFKGFLKTMSFVNAVAWEANRLMHHPDLHVSFNKCHVVITTHDAGNSLTEKDFQLAKRIDSLLVL